MARGSSQKFAVLQRESLGILVLLALSIVALAMIGIPQSRAAFSSVEVQYADRSAGGLLVVPASCPSNPHSGEHCNTCTAAYICIGSDRYYRSSTCQNSFVENCPFGCSNGACLSGTAGASAGSCTPQYFCFGNDLLFRSSQCQDSFIQTCFYGCSGGACNLAAAGTINIEVSPAVVRVGQKSTVTWTSAGMDACSVTEDNPDFNDAWSGFTGIQETSNVTQRTTYLLTCREEDGDIYTDTATVNVLPVFQET